MSQNADSSGDGTGADTRRVVGRVGRPHGLTGEVTVQVRTDFPDQRFAVGAQLWSDTGRTLTVETVRPHRGVLLVRFAGITDREAAAGLRGGTLSVDAAELPDLTDPDEFYDHQLEGLAAVGPDGAALGRVREVVHAPASDLLVVDTARGEVLVPFVQAIVPEVDLAGGRVVLDPPAGLLD
ncbi:MAG: ribosome maturation factor RimM [Pseudonocardiales bacterium]|nr:ribosome maturation factor RimM [Pseudonocardiales bacterium]